MFGLTNSVYAFDSRRVLLSNSALLSNPNKSVRHTSTAFALAPNLKVHNFQQCCNSVRNGLAICRSKPTFRSPLKRPRSTVGDTTSTTMTLQSLFNNEGFIRFVQSSTLNVTLGSLLRVKNQKVLTEDGLVHAIGLGIILWTTLGVGGYVLGVSFLVVGSTLTRVGRARKEALGIAEKRGGARGPENLWGAAGVAAICAICCALCRALSKQSAIDTGTVSKILSISEHCLKIGFCSAIAAKSADTSSSEIGKAYGTRTFLITSFREVSRGTEGGVSIEGTIAGLFAALFTGCLAYETGLIQSGGDILMVTLAGNIANLSESVIGAGLQSQQGFTNEQVNLMNTLIGAICGGLLSYLFVR